MSHGGRRLGTVVVVSALLALMSGVAAGARPGPVHNRQPGGGQGPAAPSITGGLLPVDLLHGASPAGLAASLLGGGVSISNVTYTGAPNAAGVFSGGTGIIGFESGIVMGSGTVESTATSTVCNAGVEGPNQCDSNSTINDTPGDPLLDSLSGFTTFDASRLDFDFVPQFSTAQFRYVFTSDEYNEYANTGFNDVFAFLVNGTNCALVPGTNLPVAVDNINGGNPYGTDPQNPQYYVNNDLDDGGPFVNTEMDGLTTVLDCNATVNPGATNHMTLAIADASDQVWDSDVFIEGGSLVSGTQVSTSLTGGDRSGPFITVPPSTSVSDSAVLRGVSHDAANGTMTYTVYSDATCTTTFADGGTKTVVDGEVPDSDPVVLDAPGSYYWVASYSGDPVNNPATSSCGEEVATVRSKTDVAAPFCQLAKTPGARNVTVWDGNSGLASIVLVEDENLSVEIPPFVPGTTQPVVVSVVREGPGPTWVVLRVADVAGNLRTCRGGSAPPTG